MGIFSIFFNMNVYCVFSLESPQRGDSNEYTEYTISQYKKENHLKLSHICNYRICSKGPKNEFETAVVNEPSLFEPLIFYCIFKHNNRIFFDFRHIYTSTISKEGPRNLEDSVNIFDAVLYLSEELQDKVRGSQVFMPTLAVCIGTKASKIHVLSLPES